MLLSDILKEMEGEYDQCEILQFADEQRVLSSEHTHLIKDAISAEQTHVCQYEIMDEERYNETILSDSSLTADFKNWYGSKDTRLLVVVIDCDV